MNPIAAQRASVTTADWLGYPAGSGNLGPSCGLLALRVTGMRMLARRSGRLAGTHHVRH